MIVVPKEKPAIGGLNTYYVNIGRLLEHFQGEIGPGGVSFKASTAEGIVFFDKDELLNGYFNDKNKTLTGKQAIDFLITADYEYNFQLDIYRIAQEEIYFWSNLSDAETVHSDISTKTTDLESLIKKMNAENLTGIIDASIESSGEEGLIFFSNGEIVGGSFSWTAYGEIPLKKNIENLIEKTGVKNVAGLVIFAIRNELVTLISE